MILYDGYEQAYYIDYQNAIADCLERRVNKSYIYRIFVW